MPVATRKQIRDSVLETTQQLASQIGSLVEDFINISMQEIGSPAWVFKNERHYLWSWLKRKTTFTATSEDTVLERDIDKIALVRQTDSPVRIVYLPDEIFYRELPNPTESGNPRIYRLWEITGISTKLSTASTITIVSSSALDNTSYKCVVSGYVSGRMQSEEITMNGTTASSGSITFDAREIFISKSANFNGNITIKDASANTLVIIGPQEISPRFKVMSLWPTPSSTTVYIEYYKKIKELNFDDEMPEFDPKWHHIVRLGALAKTYQHLGRVDDFAIIQNIYQNAIRGMIQTDSTNPDAISYMRKRDYKEIAGVRLHLSEDVIV